MHMLRYDFQLNIKFLDIIFTEHDILKVMYLIRYVMFIFSL